MNSPEMTIGRFKIGDDAPCFVIAEVGHNHQGSIDTAIKLVDEAAASGAHAYKLQKRDNKTLYTKAMFDKPYENENSFGATYGEHREFLEFDAVQYREIKHYAESKGLVFFSTAFDFPSVDFLEKLDVPAYKIASGDVTNLPLLEVVARTGKPVIFSTGAAALEEVRCAYETVRKYNSKIAILHCTACYPVTQYREINLNVIPLYKREFPDAVIGYSGHDNGIVFPVAAYLLGARIVEKHFTMNRSMKGTDHKFSLEPIGMRKMTRDLERVRESLHQDGKIVYESEKSARVKMGKSIVLLHELPAGTCLTAAMLGFKSPGEGIAPLHMARVLGRKLKRSLPMDALLTWEDLEDVTEPKAVSSALR